MMRRNLETLQYQLFIIFLFFVISTICKSIREDESEKYNLIEFPMANKRFVNIDIPRRFCGSALTDKVMSVCEGYINSKKSDPYYRMKWNPDHEPETENEVDISTPMIPKFRAQNAVRFKRQGRSKIVDECCIKGCTNAEVQTYCKYLH